MISIFWNAAHISNDINLSETHCIFFFLNWKCFYYDYVEFNKNKNCQNSYKVAEMKIGEKSNFIKKNNEYIYLFIWLGKKKYSHEKIEWILMTQDKTLLGY